MINIRRSFAGRRHSVSRLAAFALAALCISLACMPMDSLAGDDISKFIISIPITDTTLFLRSVESARFYEIAGEWKRIAIRPLYAIPTDHRTREGDRYHTRKDTAIFMDILFTLPANYSIKNVAYDISLQVTFNDSVCTNDSLLYAFCASLKESIHHRESQALESLFLRETKAHHGHILSTNSILWAGPLDTLKGVYVPNEVAWYPEFAFRNTVLLANVERYLSQPLAQIEQFRQNSFLGFAKFTAHQVYFSSRPSYTDSVFYLGDEEFFSAHVLYGSVGSFRLRNDKNWSAFPKFIDARSAAQSYLDSIGTTCQISDTGASGFTHLPADPKQFCPECGSGLIIGLTCGTALEPRALLVQLPNQYQQRVIKLVDARLLRPGMRRL